MYTITRPKHKHEEQAPEYNVKIGRNPSCSCPFSKKSNACKHQWWVMLYILQVPKEHHTLHQVALELMDIFKCADQFPAWFIPRLGSDIYLSLGMNQETGISLTIPILLGVPNMQTFLTLSLPAHTLLGVLNLPNIPHTQPTHAHCTLLGVNVLDLQTFLTVSLSTHTQLGVLNLLSLSLPTLLEVLNNQVFLYLQFLLYQTVPLEKNKYSSDIHT